MPRKRRPKRLVHAEITRKAHKDGTYERLLEEQGGVCAICKQPQRPNKQGKMQRFDIDHNHSTLHIRGLLHRYCNLRLRRGSTSEWHREAAKYLERNGE